MDARTAMILEAPPLRTLVRLASPSAAAFFVQSAVSMTEVWYVGRLGVGSLAAMALVFPLFMLINMLSGGAMGGAVTAAVARALGGGSRERAEALVAHALMIAAALYLLFGLVYLLFGRVLLQMLGGEAQVLEAALTYTNILFSGAFVLWGLNTIAAIYRGMGETAKPARLIMFGALVQVPLAGVLILGPGPLPTLGLVGAAIAVVSVGTMTFLLMLRGLLDGSAPLQLRWSSFAPRGELFWDILRVGLLAAPSPLFTVLTITTLTGLVGRFGPEALAGYGIGSRLEFLMVPLIFGVGSAMTIMVGTHVGAGRIASAERIGFVGAALAAAISGSVGILLAIFPGVWVGLFTSDPLAYASGQRYLQIVGPAFLMQGVGFSLYFASQGAGRVLWPMLFGLLRLVVSVLGGWFALEVLGTGFAGIYVAAAVGITLYGLGTALAVWMGAWRVGRAPVPAPG